MKGAKAAAKRAIPGASALPAETTVWGRFWFDFAISRAKLRLLRFGLFALIALDAWLQLEHAPRYGAGGFNVSHLPWLEWLMPGPSRAGMEVVYLLQAYLGVRIALGVSTGWSVKLLTVLYGYAYFVSQLDSYQHHYFIFLLLVVSCFVPWHQTRPAADDASAQPASPNWAQVRSWAVRLVMVQIAVLYFWAAITKLAPHWTDGAALQAQVHANWSGKLIEKVFGAAAPGDPGGYATAAVLVLLTEALLCVGVLFRKLWPFVLPVGLGLHIGIETSGFRIGLFSYFMVALYVLFIPDSWLHWLEGKLASLTTPMQRASASAWTTARRMGVGGAIAVILVTSPMIALIALPNTILVAVLAGAIALGSLATALRIPTPARRSAAALAGAHVVACVAMLAMNATTSQVHAYYKYWGGTARRLGAKQQEMTAYRGLTRVSPRYGPAHYHLGKLLAREGKDDEALRQFKLSQKYKPEDYRAILGEASLHHRARRGPEALDAAERALRFVPGNRAALSIKSYWSTRAPAPPSE